MAYVYLHKKSGTEEVFYVGIGSDSKFRRANSISTRTKFWMRIYKKYGRDVIIYSKNISWDEACIIEKELILKYGRVDKNTGTLCNLTDGGEGTPGRFTSQESRERYSLASRGRKNIYTEDSMRRLLDAAKKRIGKPNKKNKNPISDATRLKLREAMLKRKYYPASDEAKIKMSEAKMDRFTSKIIVWKEGIIWGAFKSATECAKYINYSRLSILEYSRRQNHITRDGYSFTAIRRDLGKHLPISDIEYADLNDPEIHDYLTKQYENEY